MKLFELHPRTREMWAQVGQTARDAGPMGRWPRQAIEVAALHEDAGRGGKIF